MRKLFAWIFIFVLMLHCTAQASVISLETEQGAEGVITYITANEDEQLSDFLMSRLDMDDALILLRSGAEITGTGYVNQFWKNDKNYASLRFVQQGKIRFGRYGQTVSCVLIDAMSGEEVSLGEVLGDLDALGSFLDVYVEEKVLPHISTYLDTSELLPVPLDNVYLAQDGLTVHYPADRFSFFSGNCGAIEIKYFELAEVLDIADSAVTQEAAQRVVSVATHGMLLGVKDVWLDMTLNAALAMYGEVTEPDYIAGGEIYEVEEPALRGVQLIAPRDAQEDTLLTGIRSQRVDMEGIRTGVTARSECIAAFGEPQGSVVLDAATAEDYRVAEGCVDIYTAGAYTLKMYYDINDVLFAAEVSR